MIDLAFRWCWLIETAAKKTAAPEDWMTLIVTKSGFCLYLILLCSIIGVAVILMKWIALRAGKIIPPALGKQFLDLAKQRDMRGMADLCQRFEHIPLARVTYAGLEVASAGVDVVEKEMSDTARFELQDRASYLTVLGVLSYVATLIGLLGTVTGMITAFRNIHVQGTTSTEFVAAGVYESLLNTAEGLIVAIVFYLAFHYFRTRANILANQFDEYITRFVKALFHTGASGGGLSS